MSEVRPASRGTPIVRLAALSLCAVMVSGCGAIVARMADSAADSLSQAILNQDDPAIVRDAAPAYLVLLDSLVQRNPDSAGTLAAAASLYAAYGATFVDDGARAKTLTRRAREYGERAICAHEARWCGLAGASFDDVDARLAALDEDDAEVFFAFAVSWLAYMRAHADDWVVLADLPKVESVLRALHALDTDYERGNVHLYLGILNTLRPPALGGQPEVGREHFERAIELSGGRDLGAKVEYARSYARMIYDRELHDRLLTDVLAADPRAEGLTLLNVLAQREAQALLDSADDYF